VSLADDKAAARKAAFARRKVAFEAGHADPSAHLRGVLAGLGGKVLASYMPMRTEINPLPAMVAHRGPVCVPVIQGKGLPLKFREWTPETEMVAGEFGALIPNKGEWLTPEVLIVPLVAFDRQGGRLGYGGGFYDRTLEGLRARGPVVAIGYAWAAQEAAGLPLEPTDQVLDMVVTERGLESGD
jgi:5-formyltetrahydrofolate cyclo-ligase